MKKQTFRGIVDITCGDAHIHQENLVTDNGLKSLLRTITTGSSQPVAYIGFGTGLSAPSRSDTQLLTPYYVPIYASYVDPSGAYIRFSYQEPNITTPQDTDPTSLMDGMNCTEVGLFTSSYQMLSRTRLTTSVVKTAEHILTGTWEYYIQDEGLVQTPARNPLIVIEPFRGALVYCTHVNGRYKRGTQIDEPTWYGLDSGITIKGYWNFYDDTPIEFPFTVTDVDVYICPVFDNTTEDLAAFNPLVYDSRLGMGNPPTIPFLTAPEMLVPYAAMLKRFDFMQLAHWEYVPPDMEDGTGNLIPLPGYLYSLAHPLYYMPSGHITYPAIPPQ